MSFREFEIAYYYLENVCWVNSLELPQCCGIKVTKLKGTAYPNISGSSAKHHKLNSPLSRIPVIIQSSRLIFQKK